MEPWAPVENYNRTCVFRDVIWYKFHGKLAYGHDAAQQFVHNGQTTFYIN